MSLCFTVTTQWYDDALNTAQQVETVLVDDFAQFERVYDTLFLGARQQLPRYMRMRVWNHAALTHNQRAWQALQVAPLTSTQRDWQRERVALLPREALMWQASREEHAMLGHSVTDFGVCVQCGFHTLLYREIQQCGLCVLCAETRDAHSIEVSLGVYETPDELRAQYDARSVLVNGTPIEQTCYVCQREALTWQPSYWGYTSTHRICEDCALEMYRDITQGSDDAYAVIDTPDEDDPQRDYGCCECGLRTSLDRNTALCRMCHWLWHLQLRAQPSLSHSGDCGTITADYDDYGVDEIPF